MKLFVKNILLSVFAIAISACVSEEGAREHAEKGQAAGVGMIPGMMWKAIVYGTDSKKVMELGRFESRSECHRVTRAHTVEHGQPKKGHPASACVVVSSDN